MHGRMTAYIEPSILKWARDRISATPEIICQKVEVKLSELLEWEDGKSFPSYASLRKLAKFYNLHISVFYLPAPPKSKKHGSINLRRFVGVVHEELDVDTNRFLLECSNKRELLREIFEDSYENKISNIVDSFSDVKATANKIREILNLEFSTTKKELRVWYNELREKVEGLGVVIFQTNRYVSLGGIRGIAIHEDEFPLIILDKRDSYGARSFTIVHELVHLMCNNDDAFEYGRNHTKPEDDKFEIWANSVAAEVLVSQNDYWALHKAKWNSNLSTYANCDNLTGYIGVSSEVIARILLDTNIIRENEYKLVREECKRRASLKSKSGRTIPHYACINENGKLFVKSVLSKYADGAYTTLEACSYLGLKHNSFNKLLSYIG
jgi:Zn-dependent peptidase ImmA (M78 family)